MKKRLSQRTLLTVVLALSMAIAVSVAAGRAYQASSLRNSFLPELQRRYQTDRYNNRLLASLGLRLAEAGRYRDAADAFGDAIAAGESHPQVWQAWAASAAASDDRVRAFNILTIASQKAPVDAQVMLRDARVRADALGSSATGEPLAAAISPDGLRPLQALYDAPRSGIAGVFDRATDTIIAARKRKPGWTEIRSEFADRPDDPTVLLRYGDALRLNQRFAEAERILQKAITLAPKDADVRLAYADLLLERQAVARAGQQYIAALKLRPDNLPGLLGLGKVALDKKLIPISMDVYTRATRVAPENPDAWIGMARAYYLQSLNIAGALKAYDTASRLAPARTDFFADWYMALRVGFQTEKGESLLRRRTAAAPDDYQARFLLARHLLENSATPERQAEAERGLKAVLAVAPKEAAPLSAYGRLLVQTGRFAEAIPYLEGALASDKFDVGATAALARAYRRSGRLKEAKAADESTRDLSAYVQERNFLADQINRRPKEKGLYLKMARLLESGEEYDKAQIYLQTAGALTKDPAGALRGLDTLAGATKSVVPLPRDTRSARPETGESKIKTEKEGAD